MNNHSVQSMKPEFRSTAPVVRVLFAAAALSATLSLGSFIEFLANDSVAQADVQHRTVAVALRT